MKAYFNAFINSNYPSDESSYDLFSLRAHQGRLIAIVDITMHVSVGCKEIVGSTFTESVRAVKALAHVSLPPFIRPFTSYSLKEKLIVVIESLFKFCFSLIITGIIRISFIAFNVLGIVIPEMGRRSRNVYKNREDFLKDFSEWLDLNNKRSNALKTLDLTPSATNKDVEQKFRSLALCCHPDKHPDQADRFHEISEAKKIVLLTNRNTWSFLKSILIKYSC